MRKLFKVLSIIIICLIIFCLCIYFLATNSFLLKNVVFPVAGSIMNAEIKVEKVVISPFAGDYEVKNLEVNSSDGYSLKIGSYNSNIDLFSLFEGIIKINYLNLKDTDIYITQDVSSGEGEKQEQKQKQPEAQAEEPFDTSNLAILDINKIKVENLNITYKIKRATEKESSVLELSNYNIAIPQLKSGADGTIDYSGVFKIYKAGPKADENKLTGELTGKIYTKINKTSLPSLVKLTLKIKIEEEVTPIEMVFESNKNKQSQTYPFKLNTKISNFPLLPIFKASFADSFGKTTGILKDFSIDINGSDLINPDICKNVNGSLKLYIENLSFPRILLEYKMFKIIFLPIEILANINDYTTSKIVPADLKEIFGLANNILNGVTKMRFKKTNIDISLEKGRIQFKELKMKGGLLNTIQNISMKGYLDLGKQMDITTKVSFSGLVIPMRIQGTIEDPKPNLTTLLPGMVFGTVTNAFETAYDIEKGIVGGGINTTKKIVGGGINATKKIGSIFKKPAGKISKQKPVTTVPQKN